MIRERLRRLLYLTALSAGLTVIAYALFALVFSTDSERRMKRELRMYKEIYAIVKPREELLGDVVAGLRRKDNAIYDQVFHAGAPALDPMGSLPAFHAADSVPDTRILRYVRGKADAMTAKAVEIDRAFASIASSLVEREDPLPPMCMPIRGLSSQQIGASVGSRMNPFYKVKVHHGGIDLISQRGTAVLAVADGYVSVSRRSPGNLGNEVRIEHAGGWQTVYGHLADRNVHQGQYVRRGQKIGTVGMSGQAYAPHLHYELLHGGAVQDPIDYFFADVDPSEYGNMLYMTINTLQSLD